ncbi:hypothetical protein LP416_27690 [Polaromonas sp. P2-4]|nr:hypothetical protein LP416_27690 [Polaromonas sp. P2-4]
MNYVTQAATPWDALLRSHRKVQFRDAEERAESGTSKAGQVRALLRREGRPMTASEICMEVDITSTALVMPVLKHDIAIGRIHLAAGLYTISSSFDEQLQADIGRAVALLKRNGYELRKRR